MSTYKDLVSRIGEASAARVVAIWKSYTEGDLTHDEAVDLIALTVASANERATVLADLGLAATLTLATRTPVTPSGVTRPLGDRARLAQAARTLLAVTGVSEERVARLGRSEPLNAAQKARGDAMASSELVEGWTRGLDGKPCQLCKWWGRDGRVFPKDHNMPRHKGCTCTQNPVLIERVKPVQR